ncbi:inositol monophosphatase 1-like [Nylanderia fulva]|uniref:inositol monophosphatase 1-like n=1 Tax=Nylanderia fulva TaxID=613905 RepID=UPI0010FACF09|nr:inositol monophosphatase 1-like [Nylanderia fulva]
MYSIRQAFYIANRSVVPMNLSTSVMSSDLDLAKCCEFAKELTLRAGKIIKHAFKGEKIVYKKEAAWDFVTDIDQKVEKMFIDGLSKEFPDHKIIAEETIAALKELPKLTDEPTWFLDPIDGTINFIHTFPQCCISVGLTVCKKPVLGIIYNPMTSELYTAISGQGAFLNGKRIYTSKITELKKAMLEIEPTVMIILLGKDRFLTRIETLVGTAKAIRSVGSAALGLAYVARGALDCYHMDGLQAWDVVAGIVLVHEAGGTVMESTGGVYDIMKPNTIAASNETLARELSKLIVETDLKVQRKLA